MTNKWNHTKVLITLRLLNSLEGENVPEIISILSLKHFPRIVNLLQKEDKEKVWIAVNETRRELLIETNEPKCNKENTLVSDDQIRYNVNNVEDRLIETQSNNETNDEKTLDNVLETAAEIFTYLNYCPPKILSFYKNLLKSDSYKNIILALMSMIKSSNDVFRTISFKILSKLNLNGHNGMQSILDNSGNSVLSETDKQKLIGEISLSFFQHLKIILYSESDEFRELTNHPVHLFDSNSESHPTALIPFCQFGGNESLMGVKHVQFETNVCNSFKPKILKDQLCYTVDPNEYKKFLDKKNKLGLTLFINYNEDRQMASIKENIGSSERDFAAKG